MQRSRIIALHTAAVLWLGALLAPALAEPVKILAIGASNVTGRGVGASNAWPAYLEQMLKKKGYDVAMTVSAFDGETSSTTVARASGAIQPGTKVVLYLLSRDNDSKAGADMTDQNAARMEGIIKARGAKGIRVNFRTFLGPIGSGNPNYQADGHHLTAASHQRLAARLLPTVVKAIGEKKG